MQKATRNLVAGMAVGLAIGGMSAVGYSQAMRSTPVEPRVFSADDLGFRMTARKGETPVGQLVVRIDGEWKEVEFAYAMKLVTK